jgi:multiple sugar transport system permease protein
LPWFLGLIFLYGGPMLASLFIAMTHWDMASPAQWVGLANFRTMLHDPLVYEAMYDTAVYAVISVPLQLAAALLLAVLLNQRIRGQGIYRTLYYLPSVMPTVAASILWLFVFNQHFGIIDAGLRLLHLPTVYWLSDPRVTKTTFIIISLWSIGNAFVIFLAGLQGVPEQLHDAALVDGATAWKRFRHVTLPLLTPVIFFNLIMGIIASFQVFTTAYVITGGTGDPNNSLLFYVLYLYNETFVRFQMGYASALAWALFVLILILTLANFALARRWVYYEQPGGRW